MAPNDRPRVLFTRQLTVAQRAYAASLGLEPVVAPLIETIPVGSAKQTARELARARSRIWVFTSANAARAALLRLPLLPKSRRPERMYAVGKKTARPLRRLGFNILAKGGSAAKLGRELAQTNSVASVIHWQGARARTELRAALYFARKKYTPFVVYRTVFTRMQPELDGCAIAAFMSPSAVAAFGRFYPKWPKGLTAAVIGPTTAAAARKRFGVEPVIAERPGFEALARRIAEAAGERSARNS